MCVLEPVREEQAEAYRWVLQAQADPMLPARVLGHFTVRNELPRYFCARWLSQDRVQIEIHAANESDTRAVYLARRLRSLPTVIEAGLWAPDGRLLVV